MKTEREKHCTSGGGEWRVTGGSSLAGSDAPNFPAAARSFSTHRGGSNGTRAHRRRSREEAAAGGRGAAPPWAELVPRSGGSPAPPRGKPPLGAAIAHNEAGPPRGSP
jgi:hypothetical protein